MVLGAGSRVADAVTLLATKSTPFLTANRALAESEMRGFGRALAAGEMTADQFEAAMQEELRASVVASYRFGKAAALDEADRAQINDILMNQHAYLVRFGDAIAMADDLAFVPERAAMYAGANTTAAAYGTVAGAPDDAGFAWVGPDGPEACEDCLANIGEYTAEEFAALGEMPGEVECGSRCRCSIQVLAA